MKMTITKKIMNSSKTIISKIILFFLARGINTLYHTDDLVKYEISSWKDGIVVEIKTTDNKVNWRIKKQGNKIVRTKCEPDLSICFKSIDSLFLLTTGRLGVAKSYAQHRFMLKGEIAEAMSIVRVINIVEGNLFPKFMTKKILKEIPKRQKSIIEIYSILLLNI